MHGAVERSTEITRQGSRGPIRILLCKSGLEEHDRGVRYVARKLIEAGMEVVYTVFHHPSEVVSVAIDEDVEIVGLSSSAGGHLTVAKTIRDGLDAQGGLDILILVGGIIPHVDRARLQELGVIGVFGPGASPRAIVELIQRSVQERKSATANYS